MVKMINRNFGTSMWVAEDRVEEYKAAGHKPAAEAVLTEEPKKRKKKDLSDGIRNGR